MPCKFAVGALEPVHHGFWFCRYVLRFYCVWLLLLARIGTGTAKMRFECWDSPKTMFFLDTRRFRRAEKLVRLRDGCGRRRFAVECISNCARAVIEVST